MYHVTWLHWAELIGLVGHLTQWLSTNQEAAQCGEGANQILSQELVLGGLAGHTEG